MIKEIFRQLYTNINELPGRSSRVSGSVPRRAGAAAAQCPARWGLLRCVSVWAARGTCGLGVSLASVRRSRSLGVAVHSRENSRVGHRETGVTIVA